jgi:integrase
MKSGEVNRGSEKQGFAESNSRIRRAAPVDVSAPEAPEADPRALASTALGPEDPAGQRMTLDAAWQLYRADRVRKGTSHRTIANYSNSLSRMSADVRETPLRVLGQDQSIMLHEWKRIAARYDIGAKYEKGHGRTAADASAGLVRILYRYVQRWHDHSLPGRHPCLNLDLQSRRPLRELSVMAPEDLPRWWAAVSALPNPIRRECHLFSLLSGLRRNSLLEMQWQDLDEDTFHIPWPQGGSRFAFDLILSAPLQECLRRAKVEGGRLFPSHAATWVWPGQVGRLDGLANDRKLGVFCYGEGCRRTYATVAVMAGIDRDLIARLLNQGGPAKTVTRHYIRSTAIGRLLIEAQETISAAIVTALGSPRELQQRRRRVRR